MTELDKKANEIYPGLVVRKDLVKEVKGNAIVPSYVLEYLLGQYCATDDQESVSSGIKTVKDILAAHYVHRNEANRVRAEINERGSKKVIDKIEVAFNDKKGTYEASFANLGLSKVPVDSTTVNKNKKLLVSGIWCIASVSYNATDDKDSSPWNIDSLKPIQLSNIDFDSYKDGRKNFSKKEWIDLLVHTIGFNPDIFSDRSKLLLLLRMIPFCERNYNLVELGPKGTGKSHIYSEFSPHGMLLSGGEVTVAKLFVNNNSGKIGLVGYWDVIAFDEFAGKEKKTDKALVDILKNYMANKSFSRGIETLGAEASMAFVGNTTHNVPYMLKHSNLFYDFPKAYYDSAFIDRFHCYIPGWEFENIRTEMFSSSYGFVIDYLAEMLRAMRDYDFSSYYKKWFILSDSISTRDKDGINKTFSGLMKLIYPDENITKDEAQELLDLAIESRKRIKDQLLRIDNTFDIPEFSYIDKASGKSRLIKTAEEVQYPNLYSEDDNKEVDENISSASIDEQVRSYSESTSDTNKKDTLMPMHLQIPDGSTGISYDRLFGKYLEGAKKISVQDPYLLNYIQLKNFLELLNTIARRKNVEDEVEVDLLAIKDRTEQGSFEQISNLGFMQDQFIQQGIKLKFSFDELGKIHSRSITTDTGWKIMIDRGLDIFYKYNSSDLLSVQAYLQEARKCRAFELTIVKL